MNTQVDKGQTRYKNRTLSHSLQQTNPFSTVTCPRCKLLSTDQTFRKSECCHQQQI
jgi:hypothetical protein